MQVMNAYHKYSFEVGTVYNKPSRIYLMVRNNRKGSYCMERTSDIKRQSKDRALNGLVRIAERKFGKDYSLIIKD